MTRLREILRDRKGNGFPLAIAITLALVIIFCGISEYIRLLIIAQGVRDAVQTAVISTVNDNYDDVYHGVREGYSGGYQPMAGDFEESLDYGDIYGRLEEVLGLSYQGGTRVKFTEDGKTEFRVWGLDVDIENAPLAGGDRASTRTTRAAGGADWSRRSAASRPGRWWSASRPTSSSRPPRCAACTP